MEMCINGIISTSNNNLLFLTHEEKIDDLMFLRELAPSLRNTEPHLCTSTLPPLSSIPHFAAEHPLKVPIQLFRSPAQNPLMASHYTWHEM